MYNFLFDKKSLVLLLSGAAVAGGVLFFSGVLVGVQWGLPFEAAPVAAPRPAVPKRAAFLPAERPCRPEAQAAPAAPEPAPITLPMTTQVAAPAPEPKAVRPAPVPAPSPAPTPVPLTVAQAVSRTPQPPAEPEPTPAAGPGRYSLQIGAFRDPGNSEKVIQSLQSRGYEPYIIEQRGRSVLRTVRVGRYAGRAEALRAALEFRRREGMEAVVRPIGS
jgi:cell division septation protein DedD